MEQLSGLDALFLHAEMHGMPMHFSTLSIYDPASSSAGEIEFRQILELFEKNIQLNLPLLRCRLMEVPFNLDQPYWVEDQNFDLVYHIRHIALPKPASWQKLCSLAANLHAQPLNRGRPLWEAYIIDGLDNIESIPSGCFAVLLKVHYSMMNDRIGTAIFNSLHGLALDKKHRVASATDVEDGRSMSQEQDVNMPRILAKAAINNLYRSGKILRMMGHAISVYGVVRKALEEKKLKQLQKIKTRFNGQISPRRVVDRIRLSLVDIDFIKSNFPNKTTNDIALTIIGGGMRRYLLSKEELPEESLVAAVPIHTCGKISIANISLRTDIAKPLDRLLRVHKESLAGKAYSHTLGNDIVNEAMDNLYSGLVAWGVKAAVESGLLEKFPPANNTIVTEIPGSIEPLFLCGAKLIDSFGMGPLIPNTGLFHTVSSTDEYMIIAFTADRQRMDDPDFYAQCLNESFFELIDAVKSEKKKQKK